MKMKEMFSKFPGVILDDSTHKANENNMPFFALLAEDEDDFLCGEDIVHAKQ